MIKRGDIVTYRLGAKFDKKAHPAVVIQSDYFADSYTLTLIPFTSTITENSDILRYKVYPTPTNQLQAISDAMIDKITTLPRQFVQGPYGHLDKDQMLAIKYRVITFLGLDE